jgi:putative PD-(D/E)XK family protein DUF4420
MDPTLRQVLDDHWRALADKPAVLSPNRMLTSELPVSVAAGPLMVALDQEGQRHLLVPLRAGQRLRHPVSGLALLLRERPLESADSYDRYADLGCLRTDLDEIFTGLCADVLLTVEREPVRPVRALYEVLERWRSLFQTSSSTLGPDQLAGLFGELIILTRLLSLDPSASDFWKGPGGNRHDFVVGNCSIEAKTSTTAEGRRIRVHGADQLSTPAGGSLDLAWIRLEQVAVGGTSVVDLVDTACHVADDQADLLTRLSEVGYRVADADRYRDLRFTVAEELWYAVDERFPRVDPAAVPAEVLDVDYTLELSGLKPSLIDDTSINERLATIVKDIP